MKQFTIIEEKWARGGNGGATALLNADGNMCCLGFLCLARGLERGDINGYCMPSEIMKYYVHETPQRLINALGDLVEDDEGNIDDTILTQKIAEVNDNENISESDRRCQLTGLFSKLGLEPVYR